MSHERLQRMSDEELGTALRGAAPAWPPTPPVTAMVARQIRAAERSGHPLRPRLSIPSRRRTLVIVIAVVLALATAAVAAKLVIDIGAETLRTASGTPGPLPPASGPAFGDPVDDVSHAERLAAFGVGVPASLGPPDHVWVGKAFPDGQAATPTTRVTMAWDPRPDLPVLKNLPWGAVLMEFTGRAELVSKTVFSETGSFRSVRFEGDDAYWVVGEHTVTISSSDGSGTVDLRVTGNVFIWQRGDLTLRLETSLGLDEALAIAGSAH
jgi:hypothetical protein